MPQAPICASTTPRWWAMGQRGDKEFSPRSGTRWRDSCPPPPTPQGHSLPSSERDAASMAPLRLLCCRSHCGRRLLGCLTRLGAGSACSKNSCCFSLLGHVFRSCQDLPCPALSLLDPLSLQELVAAHSQPQQNRLVLGQNRKSPPPRYSHHTST